VEDTRETAIEALPPSDFFADRQSGSESGAPVAPLSAVREPAREQLHMETAPVYEEDLDVPAYLRQGKLLN